MSVDRHISGSEPIARPENVQEIAVAYDETKDGLIVRPDQVAKGTTVRFKNPNGGRLRIVFLSPLGKETDTVLDSEVCTLVTGGTYHFKCFFRFPGAKHEISPRNGGLIVVVPQRP